MYRIPKEVPDLDKRQCIELLIKKCPCLCAQLYKGIYCYLVFLYTVCVVEVVHL